MPRFSIAIPVYNREVYLAHAIVSCLSQTVHDLEVVVSDDCSPDDLRPVTERFRDARVKYSRSGQRLGAATNHQRAVSLCTGAYVLVLNSDDLLLPGCLEEAARALDARETAAAVYFSPTYLEDSEVAGYHPIPSLTFADNDTLLENPWLEKFHGTSPTCCLFRKSAFDLIGGYRTSLRLAYDWELYMRLMTIAGGVVFLPQVLCVYRKHAAQMVQTRQIDGLSDILDLWQLETYSHWTNAEIADVVLSEVRASIYSRQRLLAILADVRGRGVSWRLIRGGATAIGSRLSRRIRGGGDESNRGEDANYKAPGNVDCALREARSLLSKLN